MQGLERGFLASGFWHTAKPVKCPSRNRRGAAELPIHEDECDVGLITGVWRVHVGFHMGGCQNYGPFLDPYYSTAPNI